MWPAPAAPAAEGCSDLLGCFYLSSDVGRQGSGLSIAGCVCQGGGNTVRLHALGLSQLTA